MNLFPSNRKGTRRKENTRFRERDSRLAVKVPPSRRELRLRRRLRTRKLLYHGAVGLVILGLLIYSRSLWKQSFRTNPEFAVGHFEYHTNGGITARQAAAAAGLRGDMNLMEVDMGEIRSRLMAMPRVSRVTVERRLPDRLAIQMEERLPVAWITSRENLIEQKNRLFLDREGVAFKCEELLNEYQGLPIINAAMLQVITPGQPIDNPAVKAALALLEQTAARSWPVRCSVNRIHIPNTWTLSAEMKSGAVFTFHPERLEGQLDRLAFILGETSAAGRSVATVNLQMQRNVPVTFFDQVAQAPEPVQRPGTAAPLAEPRNVSYIPPVKNPPKKAVTPSSSKSKPSARRQDQDIKTILRGN